MKQRHNAVPVGFFVATLCAVAYAPAYADSQVTLYGIVDAGLGYVSDASVVQTKGAAGKPAQLRNASDTTFNSGTWNGDRWGLKGTEDLGGGLKAFFRLENGFNIGNGTLGQGGTEFGRQAYVGFADARYGTLTLGRQYDPLIDLVGAVGGTAVLGSVAAHPGDVDNLDHSSRIGNGIKYTTPNMNGFTAEALYALGGEAGSLTLQSTVGVGVEYARGPLNWGLAYSHANNGKTGASDATIGTWSGTSDSAFGSSINAGYVSASSRAIVATSATYDIGAMTLGLNYSHTEYASGPFSVFKQTAKFDTGGLLAMYHFTPALRFGGGYSYTHASAPTSTASAAKYNQFNLAAFYLLSKRTELYALAGYQRASGNTLDAFGNVIAATASVGDAANGFSSGGSSQSLVRVGISHSF
jgi:predicted porin